MKPGLIFDLDGTLVDSLQGIAASLNHGLSLAGQATHPLEAVRRFIGNGAKVLVQRGAPKEADAGLLDTIGTAFAAHYDVHWPAGTLVYDGIQALLKSLQSRGYPLAVLSNKPHAFTVRMVAGVFPNIHFAAVFGQRAGIPHKPDPTGALEIAAALGVAPADCIVIGDSTMDLETARHAGMRAIAVTWGFHDRERLIEAGADELVADPAELLEAIAGFSGSARPPAC